MDEKHQSPFKLNWSGLVLIILSGLVGFVGGLAAWFWLSPERPLGDARPLVIERKPEVIREETIHYLPQTTHEEMIIRVAQEAVPATVSIVGTREVAVDPFFYGWGWPFGQLEPMTRQQTSHGTGFFVSTDGLVLTNKHVVAEDGADYQVITADNKSYPARLLARDPLYDLALMKIDGSGFPVMELGDSDKLVPGQTVVAIGNALGQFDNTVSTGIISGLSRNISAYGMGYSDILTDLVQTDAAINQGNSGGPLLDLGGRVVGVNVAMAAQAQNVGFAIPINQVKRAIRSVQETGSIVYPFLGINYVMVNESIQQTRGLPYNYGALIIQDERSRISVMPGSAAERMGLKPGDLILEINDEKITVKRMLNRIIQDYNPGDQIRLKVWRSGSIIVLTGRLGEKRS